MTVYGISISWNLDAIIIQYTILLILWYRYIAIAWYDIKQ